MPELSLETLRKAYTEHAETHGAHLPPQGVKAAEAALRDLLGRAEGRNLTRDERRLAQHYAAKLTATSDDTGPDSDEGEPTRSTPPS